MQGRVTVLCRGDKFIPVKEIAVQMDNDIFTRTLLPCIFSLPGMSFVQQPDASAADSSAVNGGALTSAGLRQAFQDGMKVPLYIILPGRQT